jgi:hypothetical protein
MTDLSTNAGDKPTYPIKAPAGHLWFPISGGATGICECGMSCDDVQSWASHAQLVRIRDAEEFVAKWRPRLVGFASGVGFTLLCQGVSNAIG